MLLSKTADLISSNVKLYANNFFSLTEISISFSGKPVTETSEIPLVDLSSSSIMSIFFLDNLSHHQSIQKNLLLA